MHSVFSENSDPEGSGHRPWLLYHPDCPFCAALAQRLAPLLLSRGIHTVSLLEPGAARVFGGVACDTCPGLILWSAPRESVCGAHALLALAECIGWAQPLRLLARIPGMTRLLHAGYTRLAARCGTHSSGAPRARAA